MITSLLVANRGEIAVRIMATAAVLGVRTVAVHPADDADSLHVTRADAAALLPGSGPRAYLSVPDVITAALENGCDAVHPGYGFLSENPALAHACAEAGLVFVGPSPAALELFGDKTAARVQASSLGIRVPAAAAAADAAALLAEVGAVMVKAVAGGGGRGMRPVHAAADLPGALARAAAEAGSAFGDDTVYVEQLLTGARHIEVQVLGDGASVVVLGDRDCSVQRRRQKLIELAPAPALSSSAREALHADAARLIGSVPYSGLATVEFLVADDTTYFLEVNPRLQVEHTVTEQVTGLDLVELALMVASGAPVPAAPASRGAAVQCRVNTESVRPDGAVLPSSGTLHRYAPPSGPGIRVDTHGYVGWSANPRYDSLLAKVVTSGPDHAAALARARVALDEFDLDGVVTGIPLLQALLDTPGLDAGALDTGWVDEHLAELVPADDGAADDDAAAAPADAITADLQGTVVSVAVGVGDSFARGAELLVLEAMKMEHVVRAPGAGTVREVRVAVGDTVAAGAALLAVTSADSDDRPTAEEEVDLDRIRPDLAEVLDRHRIGLDEGRPDVVERIHARDRRTARENIADLVDDGSFVEYGALTIAGQRQRRSVDDLIARTPADGLVMGTATVGGLPIAVMSYDYSVLAGTQGIQNHRKTDRLLDLARRRQLPVVMFVEGGGGRPGDTDTYAVAQLEVPTFRAAAQLAGQVPTVAIVSGYCFAGNAALAGSCDVIIATQGTSLGMGGPAMIEGGGLGVVAPGDVGPMTVQVANGVVDVLVADDAAAVATARGYLGYFGAAVPAADVGDQRLLRHLVPENRLRAYDVGPVVDALFDGGSVLELRPDFGVGIRTYLAHLDGRPVAVLANNPLHLGGAIDAEAADKAARFLTLAQDHGLAVVSLCDTPGFMVGVEAEKTATVRRFGAMFVAGARLTVPLLTVVLRKGYGLGAMAMAGGSLHAPLLTVAWPTGEFGGMGLEGAVRLGYRTELDALTDPVERKARYDELVAQYYARGKAVSMASAFEIDDVIDPAETRAVLIRSLART